MKNKKNLTKSILRNIDNNIIKNKNTYKLQDLKKNKNIHIENKKNEQIKEEEHKYKSINKKSIKDNNIKEIDNICEAGKKIESNEMDNSAFIMVPINHPKINEIMNLLNNNQDSINTKNMVSSNITSNNTISNLSSNQNEQSENITRLIITLNDILNNYNQEELIIPKHSIITPLASDYIKQKKLKVIFT